MLDGSASEASSPRRVVDKRLTPVRRARVRGPVCLPTSFVFAPLSRAEAARLEHELAEKVLAYEALEAERTAYALELERKTQEALDRQAGRSLGGRWWPWRRGGSSGGVEVPTRGDVGCS